MNNELYDFLEKEIVGIYDNDTIQIAIDYLTKRVEEIKKELIENE